MESCFTKVLGEVEKIADEKAKRKQRKWVESFREDINAINDATINLPFSERKKAFDKFYSNFQMNAKKSHLIMAHDLMMTKKHDALINSPGMDGPIQVANQVMTNTKATENGLRSQFQIGFASYLNEEGVIESIKNLTPELRKDMRIEGWDLQQGKANGTTKNPEALKLASAFKKMNDNVLIEKQSRGMPVTSSSTFVGGSTIHSSSKVGAVDFDTVWKPMALEHFNIEEMVGVPNKDNAPFINEYLKNIYDNIRNGDVRFLGDRDLKLDTPMPKDTLTTLLSSEKSVIFKDGANMHDYLEKFGDLNMFESQYKYMNNSAKQIALWENLGANPAKNYNNLKAGALRKAEAKINASSISAEKKLSKIEKLRGDLASKNNFLNGLYEVVAQPKPIWGDSFVAKVGRSLSTITDWAFLGKAAVSGASTDHIYGSAGLVSKFGGNLLRREAAFMVQATKNLSPENARHAMGAIGQGTDILIASAYEAILAKDGGKVGRMKDMIGWAAKLGIADKQFLHSHATLSSLAQLELGTLKDVEFKDLSIETQGLFGKSMMKPEVWDSVVRHAVEDSNGVPVINIFALDKMDLPKTLKNEARDSMIRLFNNSVNESIPGGKIQQRAMFLSKDPNSVGSVVSILFNKYRNFGFGHYYAMGNIKNYDPSETAMHIKNYKVGNASSIKLLGQVALGLASFTYISDAAKSILAGKEPKDPTQLDNWMDISSRSLLPIWGDIGMSLYHTNSWDKGVPSNLVGPTASLMMDSYKLAKGLAKGEKKYVDAFDFMYTKTPGLNTFWLQSGMDFLVGDPIREALDPQYFKKQAKKLKKQPGMFGDSREFFYDHNTNSMDIFK